MTLLCLIMPLASSFSFILSIISFAANIVLSSSEMDGILQCNGRSFAVLEILTARVWSMKYRLHLQCFIAGPRYHPSTACSPHAVRRDVGLKINTLVPGGASGVLLYLNCPSRTSYADLDGSIRDVRSRLSVSSACAKR